MAQRIRVVLMLTGLLCWGGRVLWAEDSPRGAGVGGKGYAAHVTAGSGQSTEDGLARPGFGAVHAGQIGVSRAGGGGSTNPGTDDGFHTAGKSLKITGGVGGSAVNMAGGKSATIVRVAGGVGITAMVSGRGD